MDEITARKQRVYTERFREHGATSKGVGWGEDASRSYRQMLDVVLPRDRGSHDPPSLLDVGCGYGGLFAFAKSLGLRLTYTGIDVVPEMIESGRTSHPEANFLCADFFTLEEYLKYDYIVCNGLLTDRFEASEQAFESHVKRVLRKAFALASTGVAANLMTTKVNYTEDHMFYMDPVRALDFCLQELTTKVKLDHAQARFEYVLYLYHERRL